MSLTPWRDGWEPFDPLRPCFTCGAAPSGYFDRARAEPRYLCHHDPIEDPTAILGHWSAWAMRDEWDEALDVASEIIKKDKARGWEPTYVPPEGVLKAMARGIVAELVAARLTGLPHVKRSIGSRRKRKGADIGNDVEVRDVRHHDGSLVLYEDDPPKRYILLVTGTDPFVLRGWLRAEHGRLKHLVDPRRSKDMRWQVPQRMLHPMPLPPGA